MDKVLKYIQWGLIAAAIIPMLALICTADVFTRVMAAITLGSVAFYKVIELIRKGKLEKENK